MSPDPTRTDPTTRDPGTIEMLAGTHVELHNARIQGGIRFRHGKVRISDIETDAPDFTGGLEDIDRIGSKEFRATVVIEGRIVREAVPDVPKGDIPKGQQSLPIDDQGVPS